ncbi:protein NUCLEAR FUSION DEFECTIVE 4-like [Impatiens glandulifera]|uniref:protein NUCLEAR FUSION DEFECTIVE 4-like n=1 Tax=Impatiens glandulifera TaxID=253017 RepID=UPI001FB12E31|nr:protein NUCLEAR FUSION DEFECTIVE 4-like [Impatiens glandulifera]
MSELSNTDFQDSWACYMVLTMLQATCGTRSVYSSVLEHHLNMTQVQRNYLMVALDTGRISGWFLTTMVNYMQPWMILLIGLIFQSVGFGVQYFHLIHKIPSLPYSYILLLNLLAGNSICWINTYCNIVARKHLKSDYNTITALMSCYSLLGTKIYTLLVEGMEGRDAPQITDTYLLLICIVPAAVGITVVPLVSCKKFMHMGGPEVFPTAFIVAVFTGAYASTEGMISKFRYISPHLSLVILFLAMVVPLAAPPLIKLSWFTLKRWQSQVMPISNIESTQLSDTRPVIVAEIIHEGQKEKDKKEEIEIEADAKVENEQGTKNPVINTDFMLFFWMNACGTTLALVYTNNLGRISQSRESYTPSVLLVLSSTVSFFGRVFAATFDWYTRDRRLLSKPALIAFIMIPMPASYFLLTSESSISLYISTVILGACYGALYSITLATSCEIFEHQNSTLSQNLVLTNIPFGTLLFGQIAALLYDKDIESGKSICMGFKCYRETFIIWGSICSVGYAAAVDARQPFLFPASMASFFI